MLWITATDCIGLPCMPTTRAGVLFKAKGENWNARKRNKGKGLEYSIDNLPLQAQVALKEKHYKEIITKDSSTKNNAVRVKNNTTLDVIRQCPTILENKTAELNKSQREIADARCTLVQEVLKLENEVGLARIKAVTFISEQSKAELLPEHIQFIVSVANAKKGNRIGVGVRQLNQWVVDYLKAKDGTERLFMLAPNKSQPVKPEDVSWLPDYLAIYRSPRGLNMKRAYTVFCDEWAKKYAGQDNVLLACPSYYAVRYAMRKLPVLTKEKFRTTGSAWRSLSPYVSRNWEMIPVNGVWVGDGHNVKMSVAHPEHGRPFSPEITMVIDARTRYIVGWSLSLSENHIAVADALRHAMESNGKPLIYYSDNGSGQKNKIIDSEVTGILPRLGVEHQTGIPGNPQGRGIIERLNKEVPNKIAQNFKTYHGKSADSETVRITQRAVDSAFNAFKQGKKLTSAQQKAFDEFPSWKQLIDMTEIEIKKYNESHEHRSLPKNPNTGKHFTPAAYRHYLLKTENTEIEYLSPIELRDMFRPQMQRKAARGQVRLFNNVYFAIELASYHDDDVLVSFDIHEPNSVIVRDMSGKFICTAYWNGNQRDAFPKAYIDKVKENRVQGRVKRAQDKIDEAKAELNPMIESNANTLNLDHYFVRIEDEPEPIFTTEADKNQYYKTKGRKL